MTSEKLPGLYLRDDELLTKYGQETPNMRKHKIDGVVS